MVKTHFKVERDRGLMLMPLRSMTGGLMARAGQPALFWLGVARPVLVVWHRVGLWLAVSVRLVEALYASAQQRGGIQVQWLRAL